MKKLAKGTKEVDKVPVGIYSVDKGDKNNHSHEVTNMEWKVMSNPVGGEFIYQVYRIRDPREPMHSGNIETTGKIYDTEEEAQAAADQLNRETE